MDVVVAIFNTVLVVFIVTTMLSAGFNTTIPQITAVFTRVWLVVGVLVVGFVVRPLVGWGASEVFSLAAPAFIAMALVWACPGAPFGAKLVDTAKADLQSGAVLQVLLASVGSITFAPTANAIIAAGDLGDDLTLPVGELIRTVAILQLVPFAIGLLVRHWTEEKALEWDGFIAKTSSLTFVVVLAGALLGSWETVVDLLGSRVLFAAILVAAVVLLAGFFAAPGEARTRQAAALVQPSTNAGPAFAAVAIAFDNDAEILGSISAILMMQLVVGLVAATWFAKNSQGADAAPANS